MIEIEGSHLSLGSFSDVVFNLEPCALAADARQRVARCRETVQQVVDLEDPVYGVTTGFGELANIRIQPERTRILQERLIRSHAAGVGEPLPPVAVRGMLLLRANTLARGHSGVRPVVIDRLLALLNNNALPVVPSRGSVGASGDLAPLAHLALPLLGRGKVLFRGTEVSGAECLAQLGLEPLTLEPKEGLALINGTQAMTSLLALAVLEGRRLVGLADLIGALSCEALRGTDAAFQQRLHKLRPHPGQEASAANIWGLMQGSRIRESHRRGDLRVQDPYSLRCMPQVHGAVRDVLSDVERKVEIEMNSVTDNPLVFPDDDEVVSGGNFHGEPMAFGADFLAIALSELASISERRTEKLTQSTASGLPPFLAAEPGIDSGFMIAQVTSAALVSENKGLCHPASVDSIPTSAAKEDHVSMGMGAALKLGAVVKNVKTVLAIELLLAGQGIDFLRPLSSSEPLEELHRILRSKVESRTSDRELSPDIEAAVEVLDLAAPLLADLR